MILAKLKLAASIVAAGAAVLAFGAALLFTLPHSLARDGQEGHKVVAAKAESAHRSPGRARGRQRHELDRFPCCRQQDEKPHAGRRADRANRGERSWSNDH